MKVKSTEKMFNQTMQVEREISQLTYKQLQDYIKEAKAQGFTGIKLNASKEALIAEVEAIQASKANAAKEVETATSVATVAEPEVDLENADIMYFNERNDYTPNKVSEEPELDITTTRVHNEYFVSAPACNLGSKPVVELVLDLENADVVYINHTSFYSCYHHKSKDRYEAYRFPQEPEKVVGTPVELHKDGFLVGEHSVTLGKRGVYAPACNLNSKPEVDLENSEVVIPTVTELAIHTYTYEELQAIVTELQEKGYTDIKVSATKQELEDVVYSYMSMIKVYGAVDLENADTTCMVTTVINRKTDACGDICKVELLDRESLLAGTHRSYQWDCYGDGTWIRNTDLAPACNLSNKPAVELPEPVYACTNSYMEPHWTSGLYSKLTCDVCNGQRCDLWLEGVEGVPTGDHHPGQAVYPDWDESYSLESYLNSYCDLACSLNSKLVDPLDLECIEPRPRRVTNLTFEIDSKVDLVQHVTFSTAIANVNRVFDQAANKGALAKNIEAGFISKSDTHKADLLGLKPASIFSRQHSKGYDLVLYIGNRHRFDRSDYDWWKVDGMTIFSTTEPTIEYKSVVNNYYQPCKYCPCGQMTINDCAGGCGAMEPVQTIILSEDQFKQVCEEHGFTCDDSTKMWADVKKEAFKDTSTDPTENLEDYQNADVLVANITYHGGDDVGRPMFHYYDKRDPVGLLKSGVHQDRFTSTFSEVHGAACSIASEVTSEGVLKITPEGYQRDISK